MSYTPTTWTTGDTITATALNKIENGIAGAGGVLICNSSFDGEDYILDKTVQEIYDALLAGTPAYIKFQYGTLGASGTGDYTSTLYLAPIIAIVGYAYTTTIRIIASKPMRQIFDNEYYNYAAGVLVYSATALDVYPIFHKATSVNTSAMDTSTVADLT